MLYKNFLALMQKVNAQQRQNMEKLEWIAVLYNRGLYSYNEYWNMYQSIKTQLQMLDNIESLIIDVYLVD